MIDLQKGTVGFPTARWRSGARTACSPGGDGGPQAWALIASLIETLKLHGVEPYS